MLTPIELQSKIFKSAGMSGYAKVDVDAFFSLVTANYEELYKENLTLKENINNLNIKLGHYKEIEKSLQKALVLAETTAEETILGAKKNATVIEQEAVLKAQSIVADAKIELEHITIKTAELLQQYEVYRAQYRALCQSHIDMINSEAFNLDVVTVRNLDRLEKDAAEHVQMLQAAPVSDPADLTKEPAVHEDIDEPEEDFDETLSTDESMIKDFSDMFAETPSEVTEE